MTSDTCHRHTPLVVIACPDHLLANSIAHHLEGAGAAVCCTHSLQGCLRVTSNTAPDFVLVDPRLPKRLTQLLHAHPSSVGATVLSLTAPMDAILGAWDTPALVPATMAA